MPRNGKQKVVLQQKGHEFVVIEATNPWTASMCEKYGGLAIESEAYGDDIRDSLPIGPRSYRACSMRSSSLSTADSATWLLPVPQAATG